MRRANLPNQSPEGRDQNIKLALKLMAAHAQQLATLNKHRGKGQQKVTVEHVNIEPGGQAIVGAVESNRTAVAKQDDPTAIEHKPEVPLNSFGSKAKAPSKRSE